MDTQEIREKDDLVDTDTDLEHYTVHNTEELEKNTEKILLMLFLKLIKMMKFLMKQFFLMLLKRQILK